uniref:Uncharacterized protein n=1 Tax=Nuclearia simplex TaxID=154970 RepID=M1JZR2_9EUKA|nr:hypothetical protein H891_mgp25 [Nuclearia simplex]AGE93662.1 hypothetical protein [Nuclearia simplex]
MFLVMSVLSWFKFSLWNHWYRPKKFNIFLASRPSALAPFKVSQPSFSLSPQKGGRVAGKNDFLTIPNSLSFATVFSNKNFLFGSSSPSARAAIGARGSSFGLVANLNLILFKSNLFLSLHHATRAINLGLIYINFNPVKLRASGKSNVSAFSVQPLNIISIVDFNNNSQNVRSKVNSTDLRHVPAPSPEGGKLGRAGEANSVRVPRVPKLAHAPKAGRASPLVTQFSEATGVGRVHNFHIFTGLQFWFGFSSRVSGNYSSPFFFKALNFPYFLINPNIKSIIYLHPNAEGSTQRVPSASLRPRVNKYPDPSDLYPAPPSGRRAYRG